MLAVLKIPILGDVMNGHVVIGAVHLTVGLHLDKFVRDPGRPEKQETDCAGQKTSNTLRANEIQRMSDWGLRRRLGHRPLHLIHVDVLYLVPSALHTSSGHKQRACRGRLTVAVTVTGRRNTH